MFFPLTAVPWYYHDLCCISCTVPMCRIPHRKLRGTKQELSRGKSGHQLSCCLVPCHFQCNIICLSTFLDVIFGCPLLLQRVRRQTFTRGGNGAVYLFLRFFVFRQEQLCCCCHHSITCSLIATPHSTSVSPHKSTAVLAPPLYPFYPLMEVHLTLDSIFLHYWIQILHFVKKNLYS